MYATKEYRMLAKASRLAIANTPALPFFINRLYIQTFEMCNCFQNMQLSYAKCEGKLDV